MKKGKKLLREQKGLSLVEVVVSMGVLVALFALYAVALNTTTLTKKLRYQNVAYHVANKKIEELRGVAFVSLPPSGTISDSLLSQIPAGSGSFTVVDYSEFSGLKEITVTVTWNEGAIAKQVLVKTLAGSGGINP
ncbi:MAG: hypothetical protein A3B10_03900 [Candidatus Doudnabacteria bacterium RIFCSPLOWO2_01_FULL_44_21]|uniref:Prepilin-type N-terminal cleavage/methylation domain-containing protein n=1 Tax=Candidatus Doudnabacteria bacterium RIFCSPLOWO2_01_FULL_44_21 TaxID=1817841 RepID=A0A1F5PY84_9BACT|nr:MAG: hypothetical protein A3B95_01945 [Candidatus Doudnabacteria bacterium RIFCSPHIGHO2_02_FULL_43_13b]OGE94901.1 MAG: hypothetical protein A3B10_03900 [Candidatus Doudnabacteria bacterium RIFCSPLOWO2_01_FULL_44_21]